VLQVHCVHDVNGSAVPRASRITFQLADSATTDRSVAPPPIGRSCRTIGSRNARLRPRVRVWMCKNTVHGSHCFNGQSVEQNLDFLSSIVDPTDREPVHRPWSRLPSRTSAIAVVRKYATWLRSYLDYGVTLGNGSELETKPPEPTQQGPRNM
jgi:hypothetical protein